MRRFLFRLALLAVLVAAHAGGLALFDRAQREAVTRRTLEFRLPLPPDVAKRYVDADKLVITNVVVAGPFSDWSADDARYRMSPAGPGRWRLEMAFDPGWNQYKFVAHVARPARDKVTGTAWPIIWVQDPAAQHLVPDGYDGWNSVVVIRDVREAAAVYRFATLGLAIAVALLLVLDPAVRWLLRRRLSFRAKLVLAVVALGLLGNLAFLAYNRSEQAAWAELAALNETSLLHAALVAAGVDPLRLGEQETADRAQAFLRRFHEVSRARTERSKHTNPGHDLARLLVLDPNLRLLSVSEFDNDDLARRALAFGYTDPRRFCQELAFRVPTGLGEEGWAARGRLDPADRAFFESRYESNAAENGWLLRTGIPAADRERLAALCERLDLSWMPFVRRLVARLEQPGLAGAKYVYTGEHFLTPITVRHRHVGYYLASFHPQLRDAETTRILEFNLYLLAVCAAVLFLLLRAVGGLVTAQLVSLTDWTKAVAAGDFAMAKAVRTGDELETLAGNFDRMRLALAGHLRRLEVINDAAHRLQEARDIDSLYMLLLFFVTSGNGLGFNRAVVLLAEGDELAGRWAIGPVDRAEGEGIYASFAPGTPFDASAELAKLTRGEFASSALARAARGLRLPVGADAPACRAFREGRPARGDAACGVPEELELARRFDLGEYLAIPLARGVAADGADTVGILLVDNVVTRAPLGAEAVDSLSILTSEFSVTLANASMLEELRAVDRLKDEFMANTSHELRTPLVGIIGIAESLLDGAAGPVSAEQRRNLAMIVGSGRRLASLVNDILDFSKLKHGRFELRLGAVDVGGVAGGVLAVARALVGGKPLVLELVAPAGLPPALADEDRLAQILFNLVGNAVKFTEAGRITVTVSAEDDGGRLRVEVADTGIGIPADKLERVFIAFEQADGSIARAYGGTGLGLSVTKSLVELHGGVLGVVSTPGAGSTFSFTLPAAPPGTAAVPAPAVRDRTAAEALDAGAANAWDDAAAGAALAAARVAGDGDDDGRPRILVVDDEPINLQVLSNHLRLQRYAVEQAACGEDALAMLGPDGRFDLVLLDVMMPRMSGYEVCRIVRETSSMLELPVLMLTAKNRVSDVVEGFESGANDYLTKPFDKRELLSRVGTLLALRRAVAEHNRYELLKQELDVARRLQRSIIPDRLPAIPGLAIAARYLPMTEVGGDYYDIVELPGRRLTCLVADVSGHGVPAALVAAMAKVAFGQQRAHAARPERVLEGLAAEMEGKLDKGFLTAGCLHLDLEARRLVYASAGHPPLVIWRRSAGRLLECKPRGRLIGCQPAIDVEAATLDLVPGDRVFLCTDGITEAFSPAGEDWGDERFAAFVRESAGLSAEACADALVAALRAWTGRSEDAFDDDVTLVVFDVA